MRCCSRCAEFYVGQSYDVLQQLGVVVPDGEQAVVLAVDGARITGPLGVNSQPSPSAAVSPATRWPAASLLPRSVQRASAVSRGALTGTARG